MGKLRKTLADQIKQRRGTRTEQDFAKFLGISQSSLSRIEKEEQNVTVDTLEQMCKKLKCSVGELLPDSNTRAC